jgi:hypothetical protein
VAFSYCAEVPEGRLAQGEILQGIFEVRPTADRDSSIPGEIQDLVVHAFDHGYCIVVTNDCDLHFDNEAASGSLPSPETKLLHHLLFCPLWPRGALPGGKSELYRNVRSNNDSRYHYFPEGSGPNGVTIPELYADFKLLFGLPVAFAYALLKRPEVKRVAKVETPYMQFFMQRFYFWQSRIALP